MALMDFVFEKYRKKMGPKSRKKAQKKAVKGLKKEGKSNTAQVSPAPARQKGHRRMVQCRCSCWWSFCLPRLPMHAVP